MKKVKRIMDFIMNPATGLLIIILGILILGFLGYL